MQKERILELIKKGLTGIENQKKLALECLCGNSIIDLHNKLEAYLSKLYDFIDSNELSENHLLLFLTEVDRIVHLVPYSDRTFQITNDTQKLHLKESIIEHSSNINGQLQQSEFIYDFFKKLGLFKNNIVAIGANGSGKTSLSNELKKYLPVNGVAIAAQKILIIPTFSGISNYNQTHQRLQERQAADKSLRSTYSTANSGNFFGILSQIGDELQILLDNLLAERSSLRNQFCDALQKGQSDGRVPSSKLDKTLLIWNSLIQHRLIECNDGINITLKSNSIDSYPAHQMSDGEKVMLYLIAQVLQAPSSGFIIIDEPEMFLHKTILTKLWDILENERQDCIFVYLTHDLNFATSRTSARKVWIRSFTFPNNWEIENIPENDLPEPLLLELLGSRKNILFCEGRKGSIDEKVYNILFPEFTITPVDSCFSVINYTKTFNKLKNTLTKAYGIIDSDQHGQERLESLKHDNVFSYSMAEPENLFLDQEFLLILAKQLLHNDDVVQDMISGIILQFEKHLEVQVSNYVSAKINYYFKDSHVSEGNSKQAISENFKKFVEEVKIDEWYDTRKQQLQKLLDEKDYKQIISVFNHKGLKNIACKYLKITDFTERAIKLLQYNTHTHKILKKYYPSELTKIEVNN